MKKIITGLFAMAALTFNAVAQDQQKHGQMHKEGKGHHRGDKEGMRGMEKLNLTEAQRAQIKSINQEFTTKLHALNQNDNMLVRDAKVQRKALMQERKDRIAAVLTPEQRAQFEQMHKQHDERVKGDYKNKTKGEDWKQKRKAENGQEKVKVKKS